MNPISWRETPAFKNTAITAMAIGIAITIIMAVGITLALTGNLPPMIPFHAKAFYCVMTGGFILSVFGLDAFLIVKKPKPILQEMPKLTFVALITNTSLWKAAAKEDYPLARPLESDENWQPAKNAIVTLCMIEDGTATIIWVPNTFFEGKQPGESIEFLVGTKKYTLTKT